MTDPSVSRTFLDEIVNRKKMGDKKFHSETSLQQFGENEESKSPDSDRDPGASIVLSLVCFFIFVWIVIVINTQDSLYLLTVWSTKYFLIR